LNSFLLLVALASSAAATPAQSFSVSAFGSLSASGGSGSPQTYTGPIAATTSSVSSGGLFGFASASAQFATGNLTMSASASGLIGVAGSAWVTLTLQAPVGAGARIVVNAQPQSGSSGGTASANVLGQTYSPFGGVTIDAIVPAGGLPVVVSANTFGGTFGFQGVDISVTWSFPGVTIAGAPTPGCLGDSVCWTQGIPRLGNTSFGMTCSNAHPNLGGVSVIGLGGLTAPVIYDGVNVWVDPSLPLGTLYIPSNAAGEMLYPLAIPSDPTFVGLTLHGQWIVLEPPGCTPLDLSGSNAIRITIQS